MSVRGEVLTPDDAGYGSVPAPYNMMYPGEPDVVVRARGTADVIDAVRFAREHGLLLAVRSGGHSVAGLSSVDGGMLLDVSLMSGTDLDVEAKLVRCQGGARWGDVDRETQAFGLVAPGGIVSDTGVAGLTLGGGEGWVRRKYGLSCDNLVEARVVTADGNLVTASALENPDLFWALRGGGGNFGVVTSFTFNVHPHGPIVAFNGCFYSPDDVDVVLRGYRDFMTDAPDEISALCVSTTLPASPNTPPPIHDTPFIVVGAVYVGDPEEGMKVMEPLRGFATPLVDISGPIPYTFVQTAFDEFFQRGVLRSYWKSTYMRELSDEAVDVVAETMTNRPSTRSLISCFSWGGQINRVRPEDTAIAERSARFMFSVDGNWEDPSEDEKVIGWVRDRWARGHALGTGSTYLNFTSVADDSVDVGVDDAFGRNLKRLREIKKTYDPDNFFRINNNIAPA
jgi:FAD/FMN-containing dehydrogenase